MPPRRFLAPAVKRIVPIPHYAVSKTIPNSNASVLANGATVVPGAIRGVIGRETRGGVLFGRVGLPACSARRLERASLALVLFTGALRGKKICPSDVEPRVLRCGRDVRPWLITP